MQTGTLANWDIDKTRLPEAFDLGVAWLLAHLDAAPGHYEVDGGRVYVAIEEPGTKSPAERRFESHARYADLQVLLQGAEQAFGVFRGQDHPIFHPHRRRTAGICMHAPGLCPRRIRARRLHAG